MVIQEADRHSPDVRVQCRLAGSKSDRGNSTGGVCPDPRQRLERGNVRRNLPSKIADDHPGSFVQITGSAVVAKPFPELQHFVFFRLRQAAQVGKAFHEPQKIGDDRLHLRLLQHALRNPYAVRGAGLAPGAEGDEAAAGAEGAEGLEAEVEEAAVGAEGAEGPGAEVDEAAIDTEFDDTAADTEASPASQDSQVDDAPRGIGVEKAPQDVWVDDASPVIEADDCECSYRLHNWNSIKRRAEAAPLVRKPCSQILSLIHI